MELIWINHISGVNSLSWVSNSLDFVHQVVAFGREIKFLDVADPNVGESKYETVLAGSIVLHTLDWVYSGLLLDFSGYLQSVALSC